MKIKSTFYLILILLIASFAIVQQSLAQIPCGPTILPSRTLSVSWPQLGFDAAHTACNPYESILSPATVGKLTLDWQYATQGGNGSPMVANGIVYIADSSGTLYAVSASTGEYLWSYQPDIGGTWGTSAAVANGVVYLGFQDAPHGMESGLYAFNASTGFPLWRYQNGVGAASPTVANGVVYVGNGSLIALDASTGEPLWTYPIESYSSPAVANGVVYAGSYNNGNVYAVNATTGALIWQAQTGGTVAVGSVANNVVYAGTINYPTSDLYALNASTGALIWKFGSAGPIGATAVATGVVYVGTGPSDGNLYALNASTGALLWEFELGGRYVNVNSFLAVANGVLYFSSSGGGTDFYAVNAKTGAYLWDYPSFDTSTPIVANGKIYIGVADVGVAAFHLPGQ